MTDVTDMREMKDVCDCNSPAERLPWQRQRRRPRCDKGDKERSMDKLLRLEMTSAH